LGALKVPLGWKKVLFEGGKDFPKGGAGKGIPGFLDSQKEGSIPGSFKGGLLIWFPHQTP